MINNDKAVFYYKMDSIKIFKPLLTFHRAIYELQRHRPFFPLNFLGECWESIPGTLAACCKPSSGASVVWIKINLRFGWGHT